MELEEDAQVIANSGFDPEADPNTQVIVECGFDPDDDPNAQLIAISLKKIFVADDKWKKIFDVVLAKARNQNLKGKACLDQVLQLMLALENLVVVERRLRWTYPHYKISHC